MKRPVKEDFRQSSSHLQAMDKRSKLWQGEGLVMKRPVKGDFTQSISHPQAMDKISAKL